MPIFEPSLTYEDMKSRAQSHKCAECDGNLVLAWAGAIGHNCYMLRCANNLEHKTIANKSKYPKYLEEEIYKSMTTQLQRYSEKEMVVRINQAKFPQELSVKEKDLLATAAVTYGLDPIMGELTIYQGKPFVSIDGRLRKAHGSGLFDGIESRPATEEERKARGTSPGNKLWRSEVFKKGCSRGFVGWGEVREHEMKGNAFLPTVSWPDRMAEKRSQTMALRLAFYLPLPSFEEAQEETPGPVKTEVIEMITDEQAQQLADLVKAGKNLKATIEAYGWKAEKIADLTFEHANVLIEAFKE